MDSEKLSPKKRYTVLDILGGLALISMILFHAMWDVVYMFGVKADWYLSEGAYIWQQSICWTFILLSGFCWSIGKRRARRGVTVLACSVIVSLVTAFIPGAEIRFGVLCLAGSCMLVMIPLDKLLKKAHPAVGAVAAFLLFAATKNIDMHYIGFFDLRLVNIPSGLYANMLTSYFGFPPATFYSADYFPILPWMFLFVTGYFLYRIFERYGLLRYLSFVSIKPLEWVGKNSLWVYMLHQPLVYAVLYIFFTFVR